jgi:hypothetical protein
MYLCVKFIHINKISKAVSYPLKEGEHFDQSKGGLVELFDSLRSNVQVCTRTRYLASR